MKLHIKFLKWSRHYLIYGLFLIFFVLIFSCKNEEKSSKETTLQLVQQANKVFALDNETAYDQLEDVQVTKIEGVIYYSFFNRNNYSIYIHNYATGALKNKIQLEKEGPNAIASPYFTFNYFIDNLDRIIINTNKFIYKVNAKGEIIKKVETDTEDIVFDRTINFDNATHLKGNKLQVSLNKALPKKGESNPIRGVFNFNTGEIENMHIENSLILKDQDKITERISKWMDTYRALISVSNFFEGNTNNLYVSSTLNDSIYLFNNGKLQQKYYAGDPSITTADYNGFFKTLS